MIVLHICYIVTKLRCMLESVISYSVYTASTDMQ